MVWLYLGFGSFGLLIGILVSLSESPIVNQALKLLFAFIGGSLIIIVSGKTQPQLILIGKTLFAFSLPMVISAVIGLVIKNLYKKDKRKLTGFKKEK